MSPPQYFRHIEKKQGGSAMALDIHDVDLSVVNAIRRIVLAEIPTVALDFDPTSDANDNITIHTNHSALHNEFLAHRLSLIPMYFSADEVADFNMDDYIFKLKVRNTSTDIVPVTTKDIRVYDASDAPYDDAFHKRIFPPSPITKDYVLITKLRPNIYAPEKGEEIDITFKATKDIAKTHSRWSPVSCCSFFNIVDDEAAARGLKEKLHDEKIAKERTLTSAEEKALTNRFETLHKYRYFMTNEYGEASAFRFKLESECGLKPEYLFVSALEILHDKIVKFAARCKAEDSTIQVRTIKDTMYELLIEDEDFTLLNVIQCLVYNAEIRKKGAKAILQYIGYHQPHPLDNKMMLKLKFVDASTDVRSYMYDTLMTQVAPYVLEIKEQWP